VASIKIGDEALGKMTTKQQLAMVVADIPAFGGAFSVTEFAKAHRISVAQFYVMRNEGWGPKEMRVGTRVLISFEAAAGWRREREAAAAAGIERKHAVSAAALQSSG
jgi:hypothetical protein